MSVRRVGAVTLLVLTLSACAALPLAESSRSSRESSAGPSAGNCPVSRTSGDVIEGGSQNGTSVSAFIETTDPSKLRASSAEVKLVLRMTGKGDLRVSLIDPTGSARPLTWGPEKHLSSNFDRPGDEWGMGFQLAAPGCWRLDFTRSESGAASLWLKVR